MTVSQQPTNRPAIGTVFREERRFSQEEFDLFAEISGDDNPIHVDPEFSSRTRFGRTVAHGMLLYTALRGMMERAWPGSYQVSQNLMFPAPTYTDEPMELVVEITGHGPGGGLTTAMKIRRISDATLTLEGECVLTQAEGMPS